MAYGVQGIEGQRVWGINWHRVLELVDLRQENTLATWFSSIIFLTAGIALVLLGWGKSATFTTSRLFRFIFQLAAIAAILLSADEVASLHETLGKSLARFANSFWLSTPLTDNRFFWVLFLAPIALIGLAMTVYGLSQVIANMPTQNNWQRQQAYFALWVALLCLPTVFALELLEWYLVTIQQSDTILTCFEETFEILGMYSLFFCTIQVGKHYQL